jgi:hypothetical protein
MRHPTRPCTWCGPSYSVCTAAPAFLRHMMQRMPCLVRQQLRQLGACCYYTTQSIWRFDVRLLPARGQVALQLMALGSMV